MKRYLPILVACVSILLFVLMITLNQLQLKRSSRVFVELAPVDPRSLLQGDYMQLGYALNWVEDSVQDTVDDQQQRVPSALTLADQIYNRSTLEAYVQLDAAQRVQHSSLDIKKLDRQAVIQKLKIKNPDNTPRNLYPSTSSYLFAEGLGKCYEAAEFAEFKVDAAGNAMLIGLRDAQLKDLGCEQSRKWWQGSQADPSSP